MNESKMCDCSGGVCHCGGMHGHGTVPGMCGGMMGNWGWHGRHHVLLRVLLMLAILAIVFKMGVEVGEFKTEFGMSHYDVRGSYGQQRMMNPNMNNGYNNMMGGAALEGANGYDPLLGF